MKIFARVSLILFFILATYIAMAQHGALLYSNPMSTLDDTKDWIMEGRGKTECKDSWTQIYSPGEKGHHVLWCPVEFPASFIAEWEVQNLHPKAGLCIVFFAAKGIDGENIFAPSLPKRDGRFKGYINGAIHNYHISYYANGKNQPGRETANLRKNPGFHKVQKGEVGIATNSLEIHTIQLVKQEGHIQLFIDKRKVIDWQDHGEAWTGGKMGFRQMKWTRFAYRNFNVWSTLTDK